MEPAEQNMPAHVPSSQASMLVGETFDDWLKYLKSRMKKLEGRIGLSVTAANVEDQDFERLQADELANLIQTEETISALIKAANAFNQRLENASNASGNGKKIVQAAWKTGH